MFYKTTLPNNPCPFAFRHLYSFSPGVKYWEAVRQKQLWDGEITLSETAKWKM